MANALFNIYKEAEVEIERLKALKEYFIKTASSFTLTHIDEQINNTVVLFVNRMTLYGVS